MKGIDIQIASDEACPSSNEIRAWVNATLRQQKSSGSLVIRIVDESEMTTLNHHYRKKEKPTNVLSFRCNLPEALRGDILGDIVICASVVAQEANAQGKSFTQHWAHMVVHGVLHLLGYDHENDQDAASMERQEIAILSTLGFSDPYRVTNIHE